MGLLIASTTTNRQAVLSSTPTLHDGWQLQISLPDDWIVVTPDNDHRALPLNHLSVTHGTEDLTPQISSVIICSERNSHQDARFRATITVSAAQMPPNVRDHRSAIDAVTRTLMTPEDVFVQAKHATVVQIGPFAGVQTRYQYDQFHETTRQTLSSQVTILFDGERLDRYFLITATAPTHVFYRYQTLFNQVIASIHRSPHETDAPSAPS